MVALEQLQAGIVLPIDKPYRWTSFQAVNKIKAVVRNTYGLKKFKIGHAGTLDPLATGLLLVCLGKATKSIPRLQDGDKVYTGTMVLGATTPCYDMEQAIDKYYPHEHITPELIRGAAQKFVGTIQQVPPMFSAVKIDGQRAYELARAENGERRTENGEPRAKQIQVYSFEIIDFRKGDCVNALMRDCVSTDTITQSHNNAISPLPSHAPLSPRLYDNPQCQIPEGLPLVDFRVCCGKGTYIRSLARDFGEALGSGAFLSALRREQVGEYTIQEALNLEDVGAFLCQ